MTAASSNVMSKAKKPIRIFWPGLPHDLEEREKIENDKSNLDIERV